MSGGQGIAGAVAEITFRVLKNKEGLSFRSRRKLDETVGDLKQSISDKFEVPTDHVLVIFKGGIMTDERTFQNYGVKEGDTIDVVKCVRKSSFELKEEMAEDLVVNLDALDVSGFANLVNDPETIRILNLNNSRMLAICERSISVLTLLNARMKMLCNRTEPSSSSSSSNPLSAGTSPQMLNQTVLQNMHLSNSLVKEILQSAGGDVGERLLNLVSEKYEAQLFQLWLMGFNDTNENTIALFGTAGDLDAAVERLRDGIPAVNP